MTFADFACVYGISAASVSAPIPNPNFFSWGYGARHFIVTLSNCDNLSIKVNYTQGSAHKENPKIADVLYCLALDASVRNSSYNDWCADSGYNPGSDVANHTYYEAHRNTMNLINLLGFDSYLNLLECKE